MAISHDKGTSNSRNFPITPFYTVFVGRYESIAGDELEVVDGL